MLRRWTSVTALSASLALCLASHLEAQTPRIDRATPGVVELEPGGAAVGVDLEGVSLHNLSSARVLLRGRSVRGVTATLSAIHPTRRTVELFAGEGVPAQSGLEVVFTTAGARPVTVPAPVRVAVVEAPPPPTVGPEVTSPAAGAVLLVGNTHTITWSGFEGPEVKIDLYQGDLHQGTIVEITPNDGSFEWTVPDYMDASNYSVLVRDLSDESQFVNSGYFRIRPGLTVGGF